MLFDADVALKDNVRLTIQLPPDQVSAQLLPPQRTSVMTLRSGEPLGETRRHIGMVAVHHAKGCDNYFLTHYQILILISSKVWPAPALGDKFLVPPQRT